MLGITRGRAGGSTERWRAATSSGWPGPCCWRSSAGAVVVHPTAEHGRVLRELLSARGVGGNPVSDAHLAALALEHRARVVSYDADFTRFPGVRVDLPEDLLR